MSKHTDQALLEAVAIHRERLHGAFLQGQGAARRPVVPVLRRLVVSVVVAAVVCAGCVGVSFVRSMLANNAAQQATSMSVHQEGP